MTISLCGCGKEKNSEIMDRTVTVETSAVSRGTLLAESTYTGTISAEGTASVVSLVSGMVEHVAVSMGDTVSAGDLLCSIDDEGARLALSSAEANLASAEDGYASSKAGYGGENMAVLEGQVRMAQENYEATKALFEIGAASRLEVDQALSSYNTAKASLDAAKSGLNATKSGVEAARAGVESARYQLSLYQITSPISGIVETVNVIPNNFTASGTVAFIISNAENKTVTFYVTDEAMKNMTVGQEVTVSARSSKYSGSVSEISGIVDAATGMFRIKALINGARELPDGLSVSVTTTSNVARDAIVVPSDALYFDNGVAYVYTVSDNTAHRNDVTVSLYTRGKTAISSGISDNDVIVTSWSSTLKDGSPLNIVTSSGATEAANTGEEAVQ